MLVSNKKSVGNIFLSSQQEKFGQPCSIFFLSTQNVKSLSPTQYLYFFFLAELRTALGSAVLFQ